MKVAYAMVRNHLGTHAVARKRYYDMRVQMRKFTPGEWVWLFQPRRYMRISPKWQRMYTGPFLIIEQLGPVDYRIQKTRRSAPLVVHVDKLKCCIGSTPESWITPNGAHHTGVATEGPHGNAAEVNGRPLDDSFHQETLPVPASPRRELRGRVEVL